MRYTVTVGGRTFEIELLADRVTVDGESVALDLASVAGTALHHLLLSGRSLLFLAQRGGAKGEWTLHLAGQRLEAEVVDERSRAIRALAGQARATAGPKPVRASMPGLVMKVEVQPGQMVEPGQGVVIVEAMKMENELKAEAGGVVTRVLVRPGQAVEKGAVLVEFESVPGRSTPGRASRKRVS
ncbi:MAG: biotin/lipoyl-binding protein [Gemmatimonadetes bacterium]|nr:biotin/lipoyl-binding protein [Gemmatimonadota bacterium]